MPQPSQRARGVAALDFPWPRAPEHGRLAALAPGVHWLRMPLPFALDHINLWALEDGDAWTLVDTGIATDAVRGCWRALLEGPLAARSVARLLVTHFHPDHAGLAGWLQERLGAPLWMTRREWLTAALHYHDAEGRLAAAQAEFFRGHGLAGAPLEALAARGNRYRGLVSPVPAGHRRIADGEHIEIGGRRWRVMVTTGHAPEHACLYCDALGVLIAGDQVLPAITPNVTLTASEPEANPLAEFLASITALERLPAETLVLPSHGLPFRGLHPRIAHMRAHHDERLDAVLAACTVPRSAADLLPVLFRRALDTHQVMFAMGESLAHLAWLHAAGQIQRGTGGDGIVRFVRA